MDVRKKFRDRIRKKEQEIAKLETELAEARAYLQALTDSLKLLPQDSDGEEAPAIRPNSLVGRTLEVLRTQGKPMHVNEILSALGMPRERRNSIAGQLAAYTRRGDTFQRTAPNTYGLLEWAGKQSPKSETDDDDEIAAEPPENFGAIN